MVYAILVAAPYLQMDIFWAILFWVLTTTTAQDPDCDFYEKLNATRVVSILSPRYPLNYTGGKQCRWIAECPVGYNCRVDFTEINLPQSTSCMLDKLLVSKSGDPRLTGAETYCGRGSLSVVSTDQTISIGLITSKSTPGGRFRADVSAQPATPSTQCTCGASRKNRIVGGKETGINEFPMMVGLADTKIAQIKCGGVILSNRYVLTAAHCLTNKDINDFIVIVGEHNVTTGYESPATEGYRIENFIIHPLFNMTNYDYDIALIRVDEPIKFSDRVGPVCLPFKFEKQSFTGELVTLLGWGTIFIGGPVSKVLLKTDVRVIGQTQCQYSESSVTSRQLCTYTPGKDACQDDSGGPALYTDKTTGLLFAAGIVSTGRSCASNSPGIQTRVTAFLDWIVSNTREKYCYK